MKLTSRVCANGHVTKSRKNCHLCGAMFPPGLFDDRTITEFLEITSVMPQRVQLALVAWFVNDLRLEDAMLLFEWFDFAVMPDGRPEWLQ